MPGGRESKALTRDQIARLEAFRRASHEGAPHGYSLPLLRTAMGAQFSWATLKKALQGRPVWILHHAYIVEWLDRYLPAGPLPRDGKAAAAGDEPEENGNGGAGEAREDGTDKTARTFRGSR